MLDYNYLCVTLIFTIFETVYAILPIVSDFKFPYIKGCLFLCSKKICLYFSDTKIYVFCSHKEIFTLFCTMFIFTSILLQIDQRNKVLFCTTCSYSTWEEETNLTDPICPEGMSHGMEFRSPNSVTGYKKWLSPEKFSGISKEVFWRISQKFFGEKFRRNS